MQIDDVIRRVCESQPEVFLGDHQGYYRHADVSALVREISRLRASIDPWVVFADWESTVSDAVGCGWVDVPSEVRAAIFHETSTTEDAAAKAKAWLAGHRD